MTQKSCVVGMRNAILRNHLKVNFVQSKNWFPMKTIHRLSISEVKMFLLTGNIQKAYKGRKLFCLEDRRKSHQTNLVAWRKVKSRTCLIGFSALNPGTWVATFVWLHKLKMPRTFWNLYCENSKLVKITTFRLTIVAVQHILGEPVCVSHFQLSCSIT